jgi:crotonobetainyl-CoA:carnitine CoA-transferase CaiB-like acyl-CoA transferase
VPSCLEGLKILEFSESWRAASIAGRLLAELGAEVIKVEVGEPDALRERPPYLEGGRDSYAFSILHCNKKSVLAPSWDGRMDNLLKLGDAMLIDVTYAREKGLFETLTDDIQARAVCCISPFGLSGPRAGYVGCDFIAQAASGLMGTTGQAGGAPTRVGIQFAEYIGALFAVSGVLGAVEYRQRTGGGQVIDISLQDAAIPYLSTFAPHVLVMGHRPTRMGSQHPIAVPWNIYEAADGNVAICALADKMWANLVEAMGQAETLGGAQYATQALRSEKRREIDPAVAQWVSGKTVAQVVKLLEAADVPVAIIQTVPGLLRDPQFNFRKMVLNFKTPGTQREILCPGSIYTMSECPGSVVSLGPQPGEHNREYGIV